MMNKLGQTQLIAILALIAIVGIAFIVILTTYQPAGEFKLPITEPVTKKVQQEQRIGMANPSAVYCNELGYEYETRESNNGQYGVCIFPNETECNAWPFLKGLCGVEFSYCAQQGYDLIVKDDGQDPFTPTYAVCVSDGNELGSVNELMGLSDLSVKSKVNDRTMRRYLQQNMEEAREIKGNKDLLLDDDYFDWRNYNGYNWLTGVKNQGECGSCWAFSSVGAAESSFKIESNMPEYEFDFSEQWFVGDLCQACGNCCGGSKLETVSQFSAYGVCKDVFYPYVDQNCSCIINWSAWEDKYNCTCDNTYPDPPTDFFPAQCTDSDPWNDCFSQDPMPRIYSSFLIEEEIWFIKAYLQQAGPLLASMDAHSGSFDGDIYGDCEEYPDGSFDLSHTVLIVGFNDGFWDWEDYWIIKSSKGNQYHDGGYYKVGFEECGVESSVINLFNIEHKQCNDGDDNDGDGKIDFGNNSYNDDECGNPFDDDESSLPDLPPGSRRCENNIDDDGDGSTDYGYDPQCNSFEDNYEHDIPDNCPSGECRINRRGHDWDGTPNMYDPNDATCMNCGGGPLGSGSAETNCVFNGNSYWSGTWWYSPGQFRVYGVGDIDASPNTKLVCQGYSDHSSWINPDYFEDYCIAAGGQWHLDNTEANAEPDYSPTYGPNEQYCYYNLENDNDGSTSPSSECCCGDDGGEYYIVSEVDGTTACCDTENECVRDGVCQDIIGCGILRTRLVRIDACSGNDCANFDDRPEDSQYCPNNNDCVFNEICYTSGYNAGEPYATPIPPFWDGHVDHLCYRGGTPDGAWEDCDLDQYTCLLCDEATDFGCDGFDCYIAGGESEIFGEYGGDGIHPVDEIDCCGDDWGEYYTVGDDGTVACCDSTEENVIDGVCQDECQHMFGECEIDNDCCGTMACRYNECVQLCHYDDECPPGFECDGNQCVFIVPPVYY